MRQRQHGQAAEQGEMRLKTSLKTLISPLFAQQLCLPRSGKTVLCGLICHPNDIGNYSYGEICIGPTL